MKRGPSIRSSALAVRLAAAPVGLFLTMVPGTAHAQSAGRVEVTGHVAPRCWITRAAAASSAGSLSAPVGKAVCSQAAPMLRSTTRMLNADGTLATPGGSSSLLPVPAQFGGRAALEITVSPQL